MSAASRERDKKRRYEKLENGQKHEGPMPPIVSGMLKQDPAVPRTFRYRKQDDGSFKMMAEFSGDTE